MTKFRYLLNVVNGFKFLGTKKIKTHWVPLLHLTNDATYRILDINWQLVKNHTHPNAWLGSTGVSSWFEPACAFFQSWPNRPRAFCCRRGWISCLEKTLYYIQLTMIIWFYVISVSLWKVQLFYGYIKLEVTFFCILA